MTGQLLQRPLVLATYAVVALKAGSALLVGEHGPASRVEAVDGTVALLGAGHGAGARQGSEAAEARGAGRGRCLLLHSWSGSSRSRASVAVLAMPKGAKD